VKTFTSKQQQIGEIGEEITVRFLKKRKFRIIDRNYTRKWGEIDIVTNQKDKIHFVEVKTVTDPGLIKVSRKTNDEYRPEDQMHSWKVKRIMRAVETYVAEKDIEEDWQIDLVTVYLDLDGKRAKLDLLENVF
jgi:putative endonuclease